MGSLWRDLSEGILPICVRLPKGTLDAVRLAFPPLLCFSLTKGEKAGPKDVHLAASGEVRHFEMMKDDPGDVRYEEAAEDDEAARDDGGTEEGCCEEELRDDEDLRDGKEASGLCPPPSWLRGGAASSAAALAAAAKTAELSLMRA